MKLDGKVAVVTGAGSGIGRAIAVAFAKEGARVAVNDVDERRARETLALVATETSGKHLAVPCDVADAAAVDSMFARIADEVGPTDVLVNNAGIAESRPERLAELDRIAARQAEELASGGEARTHYAVTASLDDDEWNRMIAVHLGGTFFCTRAALRQMSAERGGSIINVSSVAALSGLAGAPAYCAAKAGILGFTRSVAREVGSRKIRVNALCPGYVSTPMTAAFSKASLDRVIARTPLGRVGTPDDVARAALYLASDDSCFVTGQTLSPNGGLHIG